jgi:hypothetical protein
MPEVVVPTPSADGSRRTWNQVFPIWDNDDEDTEWRVIDQILEAIAMNSRFGDKTADELKIHLMSTQHAFFVEEFAKLNGEPHNHKEEFPLVERGATQDQIPEDRKKIMEDRQRCFKSYGKWMFYLEEVFANLGGAYREYKSR